LRALLLQYYNQRVQFIEQILMSQQQDLLQCLRQRKHDLLETSWNGSAKPRSAQT